MSNVNKWTRACCRASTWSTTARSTAWTPTRPPGSPPTRWRTSSSNLHPWRNPSITALKPYSLFLFWESFFYPWQNYQHTFLYTHTVPISIPYRNRVKVYTVFRYRIETSVVLVYVKCSIVLWHSDVCTEQLIIQRSRAA